MDNREMIQHPLVFANGILGFMGYEHESLFCVLANGDNNFLLHGIAEGSILVVDKKKNYKRNKLNIFKTDVIVEGVRQLKLSKTRLPKADYVGQVIMSINQYC